MRRWLGWVGLNLAVALLLYARTLPYEFVFDDHQRVEDNRALESVFPLSRFFSPQSQSSDKTLPRHTYRPVTTLSWALESAVFGKRPAVYRLGNIVLHGLNGALLGWIGVVLFGLAWPAALLASLLFLVHPLQSEAVAWISGRSDVLSLTLMLSAWVCWIRFRTEDRRPETRRRDAVASFGLFVLALLTRESAVCLPVALILGDTLKRQRLSWATYAPFIVTAVLFVALRSHVIGQFAQMSYWGGSLFSNALNVLHVWSLYLEKIFWPSNLRVVYWSIPVLTGWSASAIGGLVGLIFFGMAVGVLWKVKRELSVLLMLYVVFWAPTSNIVPLATLFADRLAYAPIAFLALAAGVCGTWMRRRWFYGVGVAVAVIVSVVTWHCLPAWKNDEAVWSNAVRYEPENWSAWYLKGLSEVTQANRLHDDTVPLARDWLGKAEQSLRRSLNIPMPDSYAGALLIHLAVVSHRLGHTQDAEKIAAGGLRLRPDLAPDWIAKRPPAAGD